GLVEHAQDVDELLAEPVLEGNARAVDPSRDQHNFLVLDVHTLDRADALGKHERLGLRERRQGEEAALALPYERRIQALFDRRPNREGGREVVSLDHAMGTIAHADI